MSGGKISKKYANESEIIYIFVGWLTGLFQVSLVE